jgi:ArsR family transcriptional regulator
VTVFTDRLLALSIDINQYRYMSKSQLPIIPVQSCSATGIVREPLTAQTAAELAGVFKALSDPMRLRLLSSIASREGQEACVCDLSEGIDLTQPTISHHLKVLREAGLLTSERRASWVYYRVVPEALQRLSDMLLVESGAATRANA